MHARYDAIRASLREKYPRIAGDILDAIMQDTLEMAKDLDPELVLIAKLKVGSCDGAGYSQVFFEPVSDFEADRWTDNTDVCLGNKSVIGKMKVQRDSVWETSKVIIHPVVDTVLLSMYPDGTPVYAKT